MGHPWEENIRDGALKPSFTSLSSTLMTILLPVQFPLFFILHIKWGDTSKFHCLKIRSARLFPEGYTNLWKRFPQKVKAVGWAILPVMSVQRKCNTSRWKPPQLLGTETAWPQIPCACRSFLVLLTWKIKKPQSKLPSNYLVSWNKGSGSEVGEGFWKLSNC